MRTTAPLLYSAAAALLLVGLSARIAAGRLWTPNLVASPDAPAVAPVMPTTAADPNAAGLAEIVVSTNPFSPRRTSPGVRFADSNPAPPTIAAPPLRHIVHLFGIGTTGGRATALLDADPRVPGAEIYQVGDALPGGGRIVQIEGDHVVIDTPEGRLRLRMLTVAPLPPPTSSPPEDA